MNLEKEIPEAVLKERIVQKISELRERAAKFQGNKEVDAVLSTINNIEGWVNNGDTRSYQATIDFLAFLEIKILQEEKV